MDSGYYELTELTAACLVYNVYQHRAKSLDEIKMRIAEVLEFRSPDNPKLVVVYLTAEGYKITEIRSVNPGEELPKKLHGLHINHRTNGLFSRIDDRDDLILRAYYNRQLVMLYDPRKSKYYEGGTKDASESGGQDGVPEDVPVQ